MCQWTFHLPTSRKNFVICKKSKMPKVITHCRQDSLSLFFLPDILFFFFSCLSLLSSCLSLLSSFLCPLSSVLFPFSFFLFPFSSFLFPLSFFQTWRNTRKPFVKMNWMKKKRNGCNGWPTSKQRLRWNKPNEKGRCKSACRTNKTKN